MFLSAFFSPVSSSFPFTFVCFRPRFPLFFLRAFVAVVVVIAVVVHAAAIVVVVVAVFHFPAYFSRKDFSFSSFHPPKSSSRLRQNTRKRVCEIEIGKIKNVFTRKPTKKAFKKQNTPISAGKEESRTTREIDFFLRFIPLPFERKKIVFLYSLICSREEIVRIKRNRK